MSAQRLKDNSDSGPGFSNSMIDSEERKKSMSMHRSINYGFGTQQTLDFSIQKQGID